VPVIQDKGILVSDDIVAIEKASIDMLLKSAPLPGSAASERTIVNGDILYSLHNSNYLLQIEEAEGLGLGSSKYGLIEI
jgi:uncharacterized protein